MQDKIFQYLDAIFKKNGFSLFLVGGATRDYILNKTIRDYDFATDATPQQIKIFMPEINDSFAKWGSLTLMHQNRKIDITSFREEKDYKDFRHPMSIVFVKDMEKDFLRRDFTINALYMDINGKIYDFCDGMNDLKKGIIRMIGNPNIRLKEDPLRILRAVRFAIDLDFSIDNNLEIAIMNNVQYLKCLTPMKANHEIDLMKKISIFKTKSYFEKFGILDTY